MEKHTQFNRSILVVALVTIALLLVPFVAMQFTDEVAWSPFDFVIAGVLIFGTGFSYVFITRRGANLTYKAAIGFGLGATLLMIWANLAVGLIGSGPNAGNLMYIGVLGIVIVGTILSGLRANVMARVMYTASLALVLIALVALLANMQQYPGSSVAEIVGVNSVFAILFAASGFLFRHAGQENTRASHA